MAFILQTTRFKDNNYSATNYNRCVDYIKEDKSKDNTATSVVIFLAVSGLLLNPLILVTMRKLRRLRRSTRLLISVIAFTDLIYFFTNLPTKQIRKLLYENGFCAAVAGISKAHNVLFFLHHANQLLKVWTVVLLAAERYVCLYYPFRINAFFRLNRLVLQLLALLVLSLLLSAPHLFNFHVENLGVIDVHSAYNCSKIMTCRPYWQQWPIFNPWFNVIIETALKFFLPICLLLFLTVAVAVGTSKQVHKHQRVTPSFCRVREEAECSEKKDPDKLPRNRRTTEIVVTIIDRLTSKVYQRRWTVNITCIFIFVFFLICRLPIMTVNVLSFTTYEGRGDPRKPIDSEFLQNKKENYWKALFSFVDIMYALEASILPFSGYYLWNATFRAQLFAWCKKKKQRQDVKLFTICNSTSLAAENSALIKV